jgi:hypothetical protein
MSQLNIPYRVNEQGMEQCCKNTLMLELYRREDAKELIHEEGATIKCLNCGSEMICDLSQRDGRLRWRWNANG